jgi:FK506-binding nuclear protein
LGFNADSLGWDIGLQGIQLGGERKILIPAAAAYGNKSQSGIPANSDLVFDVKCVSLD